MNQPSDTNTIQMDLLALCEGELDVAGMRRVEAFLKQHDTAQNQSADNQTDTTDASNTPAAGDMDLAHVRAMLLKQRIKMTVRAQTPKVSPELTSQISQMLAAAPTLKLAGQVDSVAPTNPQPMSRWVLASRWAPAGLAAMLLLGVVLMQWSPAGQNNPANPANTGNLATGGSDNPAIATVTKTMPDQATNNRLPNNMFNSLVNSTGNNASTNTTNQTVLTSSQQAPVAYAQLSTDKINAFGQRHSMCSKKLERLYRSSQYPQEVAKMPQAIADSLGKMPKGSLDLSQSGYQFSKAGECHIPGNRSVHLVYRTKASDDSVSLWVVTYTGTPQLAEGTLYQGDPAESEHPIFFFRQDGLVYYLVGNAFDHTRVAAQKLVVASR